MQAIPEPYDTGATQNKGEIDDIGGPKCFLLRFKHRLSFPGLGFLLDEFHDLNTELILEVGGVPLSGHFFDQLGGHLDRKSTRLDSSHLVISYAVFCLEQK